MRFDQLLLSWVCLIVASVMKKMGRLMSPTKTLSGAQNRSARAMHQQDEDTLFWSSSSSGKPLLQLALARNASRRAQAEQLVRERHQWRCYHVVERPQAAHRGKLDTLLVLDEHGAPQGTLSISLDGRDGLLCDELHGSAVQDLRIAGCRLAEVSALSVRLDPMGVLVLAALFHAAMLYGRQVGATDCLIEVTPDDACFFRQMFGFSQLARQASNVHHFDVPAVLMHVGIAEVLDRFHCKAKRAAPWFFSERAERELLSRLQGLLERNRAQEAGEKRGRECGPAKLFSEGK